ncbi:MAG: carbamoyltransferase [Candidatus Omnitrophica bacterium]|nr:carbamoyltransferase [Candidatus Omnitrophota bacterium]
MHILGLSCFYHDAAAVILRDGLLVAAAEEERFSRKKHDNRYPTHAIRFCLQQAGIAASDLEYVVFYEKPFVKFERIVKSTLQTVPRSLRLFREAMGSWLVDKLWIQELIRQDLGLPGDRILFADHHQSHAASAFYCSPFDEAAVLTLDGVGEWSCGTIGWGRGSALHLSHEIRFPHSLGLLYSTFTAFLGFEVNEGEYKVMGMAPYGTPRYVDKIRRIVRIYDDGSLWLDLRYFAFHRSSERSFSRKFLDLFGPPRDPSRADQLDPAYCDVAASIQEVAETAIVTMARQALQSSGMERLCYAGGVALNSVANWRILQETPAKALFVQPAAGDSGGALGAALYVYHGLLNRPRRFVMEHAYWGAEASEGQIVGFLQQSGIPFERFERQDALLDRAVELLKDGRVVGWLQGRFEWGPRALGNRSILADPRNPQMKEIVNRKIKFREPFRPFAPSVLAEAGSRYFELPERSRLAARFMLVVPPIRPERHAEIPAVTHVDGTGRLQLVEESVNPLYTALIRRFEQATGVPVLLNTSFNLKGEPIVNTPQEAHATFQRSEMDALVMGPCLVEKRIGA